MALDGDQLRRLCEACIARWEAAERGGLLSGLLHAQTMARALQKRDDTGMKEDWLTFRDWLDAEIARLSGSRADGGRES